MGDHVTETIPLIRGQNISQEAPGNIPVCVNDQNGQSHDTHGSNGLSTAWATVFITAVMVGTGTLAMPFALSNSGWFGMIALGLCALSQTYAAILLGKTWATVRKNNPDGRHIPNPYPVMGEEAFGSSMRVFISIANGCYNLGMCVVLLVISGQNMQSVLAGTQADLSHCYWVVIISGVLVPFTWLGTPKEFGFIGLTSLLAIVTSCCIIVVLLISVLLKEGMQLPHESPTFTSYLLALGIIFYAYSGTGVFPTIQEDMEEKRNFTTVVSVSISVLTAFYVLIGSLGYMAYGSEVNGNVIHSLPRGPGRMAADILSTVHMLATYVIILNPIAQDIESFKRLHIPQSFSWKRCVIRTIVVFLVAFIGLSLPNFSGLQALLGATLAQLLALVAPCLIYWRLNRQTMSGPMPLAVKLVSIFIIAYGVLGGIASTYYALVNLFSASTFVAPCYINMTASS